MRAPCATVHAMHITAKKSLGQNFLNNPAVPAAMVAAGNLTAGDTVLEIGPGTGALTKALLATGAHVVAVEADERAMEVLYEVFAKEIASGQLALMHADIREFLAGDMNGIPENYAVVANIPYYLSGFLFRTLLEHAKQPKTIVFLIQKELAHRIARDEKESLLSLSVKAFGTPKYVQTVKRGNFSPAPKVDSAIVAVHNITNDRFATIDRTKFFELLHQGLGGKRKQLLGALAKTYPRQTLEEIFKEQSLLITVRGEDLTIEQWTNLAEALPQK